jgi:nucleoside-diphosphate-sugar epimerase
MTRILVTGASGFVGRALVTELAGLGYSVRAAMRQPADVFPRNVEVVAVSDLTRPFEWRALLKGIETVVHLAGIAHAGPEIAEDLYDRVNRLATAELAKAAQVSGVRHLVFISSIRAQSGPSSADILRETDAPQPTDAYGRSKLAAEEAVRAAGVPFTILRPVLIYGQPRSPDPPRAKTLAAAAWSLPQSQIAAGAPKPPQRHSFRIAAAVRQGRNLHRRRSHAFDAGRDRRSAAHWRRTAIRIVASSAGVDCTGGEHRRARR